MKIEEMITANRADCSGCAACANICPKNAITMTRDAEGFAYPKINPELCIKCGKCDATCPALNFTKKIIMTLPPTFVATYPDDKILRHSASGGVFTALSEIILNRGGVVFGAGFDKNWRVFHTSARTLDELENLRGSKYVQSQIGDVYRQVKDALQSTSVLFSGTPCQCAGLKHFLGKDYDNLLTVEILCHGTPSPALWEYYIDELGRRNEIAHVNFRSKRNGWGIAFEVNYFDRGHYIRNLKGNIYGKLFLNTLISRPSCSSCKFKLPYGQADLTIGDAWGIKTFAPELYDRRGVSLVFIHTQKGKIFFEQSKLTRQQVSFFDTTRYNFSSIIADIADSRRENFFTDFAKNADKFAVMEKYYYQEDEEILKDTRKRNGALFTKNLREILLPIRQHFEQKVLIVPFVRDKDEQKNLVNYFEKNLKNFGLYFLEPKEDGQLVCTENFSGVKFVFKNHNELSDFVKKYNLTEIFVEGSPVLEENLSLIAKWLKTCNLPIKFFS